MDAKKITYREIKLKQQEDLKANVMNFYIGRNYFIPFTYMFVKLGISPNALTISSCFLCLMGFYFLSLGTYAYMLLGFLFFIFFRVVDLSDGEVARIQKKTSVEGFYFDMISHYVFFLSLGSGLGFGLYRLYQNDIYIILGFAFTFLAVVEFTMWVLLKTMLRIDKKNITDGNTKELGKSIYKKLLDNLSEGRSWTKSGFFSKLFGIYPFQGLVYTDYHITPILIILTIAEYFIVKLAAIPVIFGFAIALIPLYILVVSISKLIWIIGFGYKIEKKRYITKTLNPSIK